MVIFKICFIHFFYLQFVLKTMKVYTTKQTCFRKFINEGHDDFLFLLNRFVDLTVLLLLKLKDLLPRDVCL